MKAMIQKFVRGFSNCFWPRWLVCCEAASKGIYSGQFMRLDSEARDIRARNWIGSFCHSSNNEFSRQRSESTMEAKALEVFNAMPFLFWVKSKEGKYLWGNQAISLLADEDVVGKTDYELVWADNAAALQAADKQVFESGKPKYLREQVGESSQGQATLNVCKWIGTLEGKECCFGVSFVIE